jgi:hypothetical protein
VIVSNPSFVLSLVYSNTAPIFLDDLEDAVYRVYDLNTYQLPESEDEDGDNFTVSIVETKNNCDEPWCIIDISGYGFITFYP